MPGSWWVVMALLLWMGLDVAGILELSRLFA
jgi:hypothetical protein